MVLMKRYQKLKDKVMDRKEEFQALMSYVENKTEYLTAPAHYAAFSAHIGRSAGDCLP
jgi:hypothetical protein